MTIHPFFSATYEQARDSFVAAASAHRYFQNCGQIEITEDYTMDWAMTGKWSREELIVYSSGLHGIEGYAGSALQRKLLSFNDSAPVLWLHALNPWGMAHFRRVNENNVDLNRNFIEHDDASHPDDLEYTALDPLLNPKHGPGPDLFLLHAIFHILKRGMPSLRNAIARGQYSFPAGIFYGGNRLENSTKKILEWLPQQLRNFKRVVHIDLHTGRGPRGDYLAFLESTPDHLVHEHARQIFGRRLRAWQSGSSDGYEMRGGMLAELKRRLPQVRFDGITVEFGTMPDFSILRALRAENQLYFYGSHTSNHSALKAMRNAFYPTSLAWQSRVIAHSGSIHSQAAQLLAR